jgi:hypothetical protein
MPHLTTIAEIAPGTATTELLAGRNAGLADRIRDFLAR